MIEVRMRLKILFGPFVGAIACWSSVAHSQQVTANACATGLRINDCATSNQGNPATAVVDMGSGGFLDGATAAASTSYGSNAAYAFAIFAPEQNYGTPDVIVGAESTWTDQLEVLTSAQAGYLVAKIYVQSSHLLNAGSNGAVSATTNYSLSSGSAYLFNISINSVSGAADVVNEDFNNGSSEYLSGDWVSGEYISVYIPFLNGTYFGLSSSLSCGARVSDYTVGDQANAVCDASNSMHWAGIIGATDTAGNSLANFSVTSASGTDYTQSFMPVRSGVPEPATWAMMLLGFGAMGSRIRRQRSGDASKLSVQAS